MVECGERHLLLRQALLKPFDFPIKKKIKKEGRQTAALGVAPADTAWRPVPFLGCFLEGRTAVGLWSRIALYCQPCLRKSGKWRVPFLSLLLEAGGKLFSKAEILLPSLQTTMRYNLFLGLALARASTHVWHHSL